MAAWKTVHLIYSVPMEIEQQTDKPPEEIEMVFGLCVLSENLLPSVSVMKTIYLALKTERDRIQNKTEIAIGVME